MTTPRLTRAARIALAVLAALGASTLGFVGDAGAHSDQGLLAVEATAHEGRRITVTARLRYANDGDPVSSAEVSAFAANAADEATAPVPLASEGEGRYRGAVEVASEGEWTIVVQSQSPEATARASVVVNPAPPATAATTARTPISDENSSASDRDDSSDEGSDDAIWAVLAIVIVLAGVAALVVVMRRRR
jgi:hypothetical protein